MEEGLMATEIPDDVVERALAIMFDMPPSEARYLPYADRMTRVGRVFMEWEREQLIIALKAHAHHLKTMRTIGGAIEQRRNGEIAFMFEKFINAIRSRTNPDDCNPSGYT
jgi:hypothetical protein